MAESSDPGSSPSPEVRRIHCRGRVKWFDNRQGWGFIVSPEGHDVFVHYSNIKRKKAARSLDDGMEVIYTPVKGEKGWYACDVIPVKSAKKKQEGGGSESAASSRSSSSSPSSSPREGEAPE